MRRISVNYSFAELLAVAVVAASSLLFVVSSAAGESGYATGVVFHDRNGNGMRDRGEEGIAGVFVSNQREIVETDDSGRWRLPVEDDDTIFFVIKPRGWQTPLSSDNLPLHYYIHRPEGSPSTYYPGVPPTGPLPESIDFPLRPQEEADRFKAAIVADPQPRTRREANYIAEDVAVDLAPLDLAFGISLGDVAFDDLDIYDYINRAFGGAGIPWYNAPGNHDINFDARDSDTTMNTFERVFGPQYYAFQYGPVHFLILNNVRWEPQDDGRIWYRAGLGQRQLEFIGNYLALAPRDELVVLSMHVPFPNPRWRDFRDELHEVYELLAERPHTLSFSGHIHRPLHMFLDEEDGWPGEEPHDHIVAPTNSGNLWRGLPDARGVPDSLSHDGVPRGYAIFTFDRTDFSFEFLPAGAGQSERMRIMAPIGIPQDQLEETGIFVNVFAGSPRDKVEIRLGGDGEWQTLERTVSYPDPVLETAHDLADAMVRRPYRRYPFDSPPDRPLWIGNLPEDSPVGPNLIHARVTDRFGQTFDAKRFVSIEPGLEPADGSFFYDYRRGIRLRVSAEEGLREVGAMLLLNGKDRTEQLRVERTADWAEAVFEDLVDNRPYHAVLRVYTDDGRNIDRTVRFDTFDPENPLIEAEHFNFAGGEYIVAPGSGPDVGPSYRNKESVEGIDRGPVEDKGGEREYRALDPVGTLKTTDRRGAEYRGLRDSMDYGVDWTEEGEWLNYTREFPPGVYRVYARLASHGRLPFEVGLDRVISDPTQPDQTTERLGSFSHPVGTGNRWRYDYLLLRDGNGDPVEVELDGEETLRATPGTSVRANFYLFVPVADSIVPGR